MNSITNKDNGLVLLVITFKAFICTFIRFRYTKISPKKRNLYEMHYYCYLLIKYNLTNILYIIVLCITPKS